jgi:DNA-binding MarR family transcriptional regulator
VQSRSRDRRRADGHRCEPRFLLVGAFRSLIDELHRTLAENGHDKARPLHGFALQAIGPDGSTTSQLGRRLGVSKQAAAKTVASLERAGYIRREPDSADARAVRLQQPHEVRKCWP